MFQFKQFSIQQDRTAMKVGTDGVLLGAWADIGEARALLDIGTGTGLIALMAAQRNSMAKIDAVEIETNAVEQAKENILASPWTDRIHVFHTAIQDFLPSIRYDAIVCNPPFFNQSTPAPHTERNLARHSGSLLHSELLSHVARLLAPEGKFSLILPVAEAMAFIDMSSRYQLYPSRITQVIPNPEKVAKRLLLEFVSAAPSSCQEQDIVIELSRHVYSEEYIRLTQAFYLYMP